MTSPSKLSFVAAALFGAALYGCGSGGSATATDAPKVDAETAAQKQQGEGGKKAAAGGGVAPLGLTPAAPGEATGPLVGGKK